MKCCWQYGYCWLGRDCPHGVGRIGQKYHVEPKQLRPHYRNRKMRRAARVALTLILASFITALMLVLLVLYA